jgi:hypothetical protein
MGDVYEGFNPIRLLDLTEEQMVPVLRRAVTEATARAFRSNGSDQPPPLDVFLSHAKHDGRQIAESIRDSVRSFGQMQAWYDANDLPHGGEWNSPMIQAAKNGTAAMIATVTDAYPTRSITASAFRSRGLCPYLDRATCRRSSLSWQSMVKSDSNAGRCATYWLGLS